MPLVDEGLWFDINRNEFEEAIRAEVQKIVDAAIDCLKTSGLTKDQIELVILTGGIDLSLGSLLAFTGMLVAFFTVTLDQALIASVAMAPGVPATKIGAMTSP